MKAVDVLDRVDCAQGPLLVDLAGQRELNEDAVDRVVRVQFGDQREQLVLRRLRGQVVVVRGDSGPASGLVLAPDVDLGGGIVADEDGREPERAERPGLLRDLGADPLGEPFPVHDRRSHGARLTSALPG